MNHQWAYDIISLTVHLNEVYAYEIEIVVFYDIDFTRGFNGV